MPKFEQYRQIWMLGQVQYRVGQVTHNLPKITQLEINVLQDATQDARKATRTKYAKQPGPGLFPVHSYGRYEKILSTATVSGPDAEKIAELWRFIHFSQGFSGLCHYPGYGLRFYSGNSLVFETSVCWRCSNFSIKGIGFWGFDTESSEATNLLTQLQKHAPHSVNTSRKFSSE